ncbi:glycerophosphodiester phosphodiesterase family protein [uncultured Nitratireductor sp.]|uniref:glycerophosphodiester phosphodiesterase family protein n=1 Tax=uncultured Nitratireductor sp. TaxID=520953 RepID=UPI0025DFD448|nr:glycerophosphodiester phosphodiesterase family protein [uncultured Nitratireductor sp.]
MGFSFHTGETGPLHLCGHRGHSIGAPENTLAAMRACHDEGGRSCEIDTVLTSDGEIVVLHDLSVDRTTDGSGPASALTAAEITKLDAGSWFGPEFVGERISTLTHFLMLARELDMGLEVEVKEKVNLDGYIRELKKIAADPANLERMMMISFDHASLKRIKKEIPGILTGGIAHERYGDPLAVVKCADLDELCIDLAVFNLEDARRLKANGIAIRCHAYAPKKFEEAVRNGLDWTETLKTALSERLIDTLSGDDVAWLRRFAEENGRADRHPAVRSQPSSALS